MNKESNIIRSGEYIRTQLDKIMMPLAKDAKKEEPANLVSHPCFMQ
jgi:hypothetical protein